MAWVGKPSLLFRGCIPKKARFTMEFPSITSSFIPSHPLPRGPCPAQSVSRSAYEGIVPTFSRKSNENPPLAGPAPGIKRQGRQPPAASRKFSQILAIPQFSCYNTPGKQKCGSLWVVAHPQACAGEDPPTQRPFGRTAWGIIRYFCFPRKGGSKIVATYSLAFVCRELCFLRCVGLPCTAFFVFPCSAHGWPALLAPLARLRRKSKNRSALPADRARSVRIDDHSATQPIP